MLTGIISVFAGSTSSEFYRGRNSDGGLFIGKNHNRQVKHQEFLAFFHAFHRFLCATASASAQKQTSYAFCGRTSQMASGHRHHPCECATDFGHRLVYLLKLGLIAKQGRFEE